MSLGGSSVTWFANPIARKQQRGDRTLRDGIFAEQASNSLHNELTPVIVTSSHLSQAAGLADVAPFEARVGKAPHLAVVLDRHGALATLDYGYPTAARTRGVAVYPAP